MGDNAQITEGGKVDTTALIGQKRKSSEISSPDPSPGCPAGDREPPSAGGEGDASPCDPGCAPEEKGEGSEKEGSTDRGSPKKRLCLSLEEGAGVSAEKEDGHVEGKAEGVECCEKVNAGDDGGVHPSSCEGGGQDEGAARPSHEGDRRSEGACVGCDDPATPEGGNGQGGSVEEGGEKAGPAGVGASDICSLH